MHLGVSLFQFFPAKVGGAGEQIFQFLSRVSALMGPKDRLTLIGAPENLCPLEFLLNDRRFSILSFPLTKSHIHTLRVADLLLPGRCTQFLLKRINALGLEAIWYPQQSMFPLGIQARSLVSIHDLQHDHLPENFGWIERWVRRKKDHQLALHADCTCSNSQSTRDDLYQIHQAAPLKARVVLLGGGPAGLHAGTDPLGRTDRPYLFYPANAYPHKNHVRLIQAFRIFKERHPDNPAELVMTGQRQPHVDRELAQCLPKHGIRHFGFVTPDELDQLYRGSRGIVFPSLFEGFGIPVIEALAYGKEVYCHHLPVFQELVQDAVQYFDATSTEAMVRVFEQVFDPARTPVVDLSRYERIVSHLNWDRHARELWGLFLELAEKPTGNSQDWLPTLPTAA